jgi:hypothetical protein
MNKVDRESIVMVPPWKAYQEDVAIFFRSLGLTAKTEAEVQGARATHRVDVLVCFSLLGLKITWIVECKLWDSAIPKEKVLALHQIAHDVGADRAFLIAESAFQAGAVAAARSTNITLSSLADLKGLAEADLAELQLRTALRRLLSIEKAAQAGFTDSAGGLRVVSRKSFGESTEIAGHCLFLERAAVRGLLGDFPVYYTGVDLSDSKEVHTASELAQGLLRELDKIEDRLATIELEDRTLGADIASFMQSVCALLDLSEESLTVISPDAPDFETKRYECLSLMKAVGKSSETLRHRGGLRVQEALRTVMRCLIDTVYFDLTKPSVAKEQWQVHRKTTEQLLAELQSSTEAVDKGASIAVGPDSA